MPTDNQEDRDLLIRLDANVAFMRTELLDMKSSVGGQISDHEARLRVQEASNDRLEGASRAFKWIIAVVGTVAAVIEPVAIWLLSGIPHK